MTCEVITITFCFRVLVFMLDVYGFGMLTIEQLRDLYNMHIESMWFGTNIW